MGRIVVVGMAVVNAVVVLVVSLILVRQGLQLPAIIVLVVGAVECVVSAFVLSRVLSGGGRRSP